jgi:hypothetical protein
MERKCYGSSATNPAAEESSNAMHVQSFDHSFRRMKDEEVTFYGWKCFSGFLEGYFAETEEQKFNDRVRDSAGLGHK